VKSGSTETTETTGSRSSREGRPGGSVPPAVHQRDRRHLMRAVPAEVMREVVEVLAVPSRRRRVGSPWGRARRGWGSRTGLPAAGPNSGHPRRNRSTELRRCSPQPEVGAARGSWKEERPDPGVGEGRPGRWGHRHRAGRRCSPNSMHRRTAAGGRQVRRDQGWGFVGGHRSSVTSGPAGGGGGIGAGRPVPTPIGPSRPIREACRLPGRWARMRPRGGPPGRGAAARAGRRRLHWFA
jgi:hypothetical protein